MEEYIDKRKFIDEIDDKYSLGDISRFERDIIVNALLYAKPADVCPIIRGNWIYSDEPYPGQNPYGHYECDVCYESVPYLTRYCPKCGAYMKGKNDD